MCYVYGVVFLTSSQRSEFSSITSISPGLCFIQDCHTVSYRIAIEKSVDFGELSVWLHLILRVSLPYK